MTLSNIASVNRRIVRDSISRSIHMGDNCLFDNNDRLIALCINKSRRALVGLQCKEVRLSIFKYCQSMIELDFSRKKDICFSPAAIFQFVGIEYCSRHSTITAAGNECWCNFARIDEA